MRQTRSKGSERDLLRSFNDMKSYPAAKYIRANFDAEDRLALVLLNKRTEAVIQRLSRAEKIAAEDTQKWLRYMNAQKYEVYVSMNTLREDARGRTKSDIAEIRHIYLDLDDGGREAVEGLLGREDLPEPSFVLNSSPEKFQVVWRVEGFAQDQAETLQRGLARDAGADTAATDSSRVLRLPGFYNHKYAEPHYIRAEPMSDRLYRPEQFPEFPNGETQRRELDDNRGSAGRKMGQETGGKSQSERDWAYAKRALARGESEQAVIAAIAEYRRQDKPNPQYYAELTVRKAARSLEAQNQRVASAAGRER